MASQLHWGIIGTGSIAQAFAFGLTTSKTGKLIAVASRSQASADKFGDKFDVPVRHASYQALLEDAQVQAVYIATPHPLHPEWAIKAAEAGKHVLCEKPMALNQWQAAKMFEAARAGGVACMEAFMYRCHPQIEALRQLLRDQAIGEVRIIRAAFSFGGGTGPVNADGRLFNNELGGGGIMDVGGYPVSMARLIAGEATGQPYADPIEVCGAGHVGQTNVDEYAAAVLKFPGDIIAEVASGVRVSMHEDVWIYGSDGRIHIPTPWVPNGRNGTGATEIHVHKGKELQTITSQSDVTLYGLEADALAAALPNQEVPHMSWGDTLGNMAALDQWRASVGTVYEAEKPRPCTVNLANRPIEPRAGHNMQYGQVPGLDKPVSKLIFGALTAHGSYAKAQVMFDQWLELGGNAFDTGAVYGPCDKIFGQWLNSRGVRDEVVIIGKGMHPPTTRPEQLSPQLDKILENFGCDCVDIYIMHRDHTDAPVDEWVDVLDAEVQRGRIKVFGGSNWTIERFAAANAYADKNGKQGCTVLNNNLALAHMVNPVWGGCLHVSDQASRQWMADHQVVHMSWSSTARGFFTDRSGPDKRDDPSLVKSWYSEENFQRKARAEELAKKKGCLPIHIAAAWVLHQPFASFALVGPETPTEMATLMPGLDIELTPEEVRWLAMDE
jgi:predicted dehydrogenase/aryl-alcohol dehydrogenase-like predicted oxidoreductase